MRPLIKRIQNLLENFNLFNIILVTAAKNKVNYFAKELHSAMKGIGTNDFSLRYILVCRSEVKLKII